MSRQESKYPARIVSLMTTLQEALNDHANDEPNQADEKYNLWLPETFEVIRERFIGASYLLKGFKVYAPVPATEVLNSSDVLWRAVWAPFYSEEFLIQLVTGVETRKVWQWSKLSRVDTDFYTHETLRTYDNFNGWDAIEDVLQGAVDSYHEWKSTRLAVAS